MKCPLALLAIVPMLTDGRGLHEPRRSGRRGGR